LPIDRKKLPLRRGVGAAWPPAGSEADGRGLPSYGRAAASLCCAKKKIKTGTLWGFMFRSSFWQKVTKIYKTVLIRFGYQKITLIHGGKMTEYY